jgi:hypothetical protein
MLVDPDKQGSELNAGVDTTYCTRSGSRLGENCSIYAEKVTSLTFLPLKGLPCIKNVMVIKNHYLQGHHGHYKR